MSGTGTGTGTGTAYSAGFVVATLVESNSKKEQARRKAIIFPAIAAQGWPVLLVNTSSGRPTEPERFEIKGVMSFTECWRICEIFARKPPVQIRCEQDGSTLADLIAAIIGGDRDCDLLHRLRVDFALTSQRLLDELNTLAKLLPDKIAQDKILTGLRALVHSNESYEDCLNEFKGYEGTDAA